MMAFVVMFVVVSGAVIWITASDGRGRHPHEQVLAMSSPSVPKAGPGVMGPLSLLLINDHPAATSPGVQLEIKRLLQLHQDLGWTVVLDDEEAEIAVRSVLPTGAVDTRAANPLLRSTLLDLDFGGIIRIKSTPGDGPPDARIESVTIAVPDDDEVPLMRFVVPKAEKVKH